MRIVAVVTGDRPMIYRPIFGFYRDIAIGQNGWFHRLQHMCWQTLLYSSRMQTTCAKSTTNQVKTVILQQP